MRAYDRDMFCDSTHKQTHTQRFLQQYEILTCTRSRWQGRSVFDIVVLHARNCHSIGYAIWSPNHLSSDQKSDKHNCHRAIICAQNTVSIEWSETKTAQTHKKKTIKHTLRNFRFLSETIRSPGRRRSVRNWNAVFIASAKWWSVKTETETEQTLALAADLPALPPTKFIHPSQSINIHQHNKYVLATQVHAAHMLRMPNNTLAIVESAKNRMSGHWSLSKNTPTTDVLRTCRQSN